jgi:hypothetical protein
VIGVVEPGARAAVACTSGVVGVIATEGTVRSKAYTKAIRALDPDIEVIESAAPLFVPLAEEGWANTHVAREVAEIYLEPLIDAGIDTLVSAAHYRSSRHDRTGRRRVRPHRRQRGTTAHVVRPSDLPPAPHIRTPLPRDRRRGTFPPHRGRVPRACRTPRARLYKCGEKGWAAEGAWYRGKRKKRAPSASEPDAARISSVGCYDVLEDISETSKSRSCSDEHC